MLLLGSLWPGLVGAAVLGCGVGWLAGWPARPWVPLALGATAALLAALALSDRVPGLPGLWLESAGLILPPYLAACGLGALVRGLSARG